MLTAEFLPISIEIKEERKKRVIPLLKVFGKCILALLGVVSIIMLLIVSYPIFFGGSWWLWGIMYVISIVVCTLIGMYIRKITRIKTKTGKIIIIKDKKEVERTNG